MKHRISPSHVAVLVPSVRRAADRLASYGFDVGEEETFEETKEIYVQGAVRNSLLLMEPKGAGSYQRALEKRGPGLHHLAIDVLDLESFLDSIAGSGWLLHLNSVKSIAKHRAAYLARPGFPGLIEVQQKKKLMDGPLFVESVALKLEDRFADMVAAVGLQEVLEPASGEPCLGAGARKILLSELF